MEQADTNAAIWQSGEAGAAWAADAAASERKREGHRRFMAALLPFGEQDTFTFLDLGAGTGAASRVILDLYPRCTAVLADYSAEMMAGRRARAAAVRGAVPLRRVRHVGLPVARADPGGTRRGGDLAVRPSPARQAQAEPVRRDLQPPGAGGWYLNYDPVAPGDPVTGAAWERVSDQEDPEAAARRRHRTPEQQARWDNHVRYIIPLAPQLAYLRSAGFEGIDVYWKQLENVIYGGCRPG